MSYEQNLNLLAANLGMRAKEAAMGVGGQQVMPSTPYMNGAGMYDPQGASFASLLSEQRAARNAANVDDGQLQGTNLLPYRNVLNEGFSSIRAGMEAPGYRGKYASLDEEDYTGLVEDSGYFDEVDFIPDPETLEMLEADAMEKAASLTEAQLYDMAEVGAFHNAGIEDLMPYIFPAE